LAQDSLISDELLRQLMAVGEVDVLVGLPTLNNASTVAGVIRSVHRAFARYFPRDRTVLINSDGGSTDGTPDLVRDESAGEGETVATSYSLRTMHRISTPYHGLPGKGNALRQIMTAADLTQARAVAVLDPDVTSVEPEWIAALIRPVTEQAYDYVAPMYCRHPLDGPLVTQLIRPLTRAAYGWQVREPVAPEFGCSGRFLSHCLEQDVWERDLARYGIDLWVTGEALARGFRCCQAMLGLQERPAGVYRPVFAEIFEQVIGSTFECLECHAPYWLERRLSEMLPIVGAPLQTSAEAPDVDGTRLTQSFCQDLRNLQAVLASILEPDTLTALNAVAQAAAERLEYPDELWVSTVYDFLLAYKRATMSREHITRALIPLYLGRAGSFLTQYGARDAGAIDAGLEALSLQFERSKPDLVERWNRTNPR